MLSVSADQPNAQLMILVRTIEEFDMEEELSSKAMTGISAKFGSAQGLTDEDR
jgi:hypothetical protein